MRRLREPSKPEGDVGRSPFERDRARVLHSSALRRLAAKTQVVGVGESDFPRTRLTHSLECAQIGRELGAALGCDADLVDTACLAHDLGHPPFGHNGEAALDAAASAIGGFEGNAQSFRILTRLEIKVLDPQGRSAGLNLTRASLDAVLKYPWLRRAGGTKYGAYLDDEPAFRWARTGSVGESRCLEAQVMDWADDVAYSVHDLEDGVHARHVNLDTLGFPDRLAEICAMTARTYSPSDPTALAEAFGRLSAQPWWVRGYDGSPRAMAALKAMTSALIGRFCRSVEAATRARFGDGPLNRYAAELVVPEDIRQECAFLKGVVAVLVMARPGVAQRQDRERELVDALVAQVLSRGSAELEPPFAAAWADAPDDAARLRVVVDQVAALTDTSALAWARRILPAFSSV